MGGEGRRMLSLLVGLLWTSCLTSSFNLEPRSGRLYGYPYASTEGRESYFGFSVALQHNGVDSSNWVIVGAPRANSSYYIANQITEPGALFKCDLKGLTCAEVIIDESGNTETINDKAEFSYQDLKNHGWLGGSLDSQPVLKEDRQVTGVCAPRWRNQLYHTQHYMNGVCYWMDDSVPNAIPQKELPLVNYREQTKEYGNKRFYHYAHGQAGMSLHFPDDQTKFIVGAPGVFNWHGSIILFEDYNWNNPGDIARRRRRQAWQRQRQMFTNELVPDSSYITTVKDGDLFGYSVTSGRFYSKDKLLYAGGAPRGADSYGKVIVFDFPTSESSDLWTKSELKGGQLGEYFGAALTSADINGDGLTDLIVGSPMYSFPNLPDVGRIQTFLSDKGNGLHIHAEPHYGKEVSLSRFGTSLASPGDLNADGYEDIVVGAPWEVNGAVYIFLGSVNGLKQEYSQRLSPEDFTPAGLSGFGMSVSRGTDIDDNGYPDIAVGSFLSGHVAVIKTRPVALLSGQITASPPNVPWEGKTALSLTTCLRYEGYRIPRRSSVRVILTLDHGSPSPRASFSDNSVTLTFIESLTANSLDLQCRTDQVTVKEDKLDPDQPLDMKLEYELMDTPALDLIKQPMTNPGETHSSVTRVSILKGCVEKICKVDMMFVADLDLGQDKTLVVGQKNRLVLHAKVSNSKEPVYLPTMNVTVSPPLTLILPQSHDCKFLDVDLRTSLECSLSNPIKTDSLDVVQVKVDASQLTDSSEHPWIQVNVSGEGEEVNPNDNKLFMSLPLEAHATLHLYGDSKEEQVFYEHVGDDSINATNNLRFIHKYTLMKQGPTPLGHVNITIDIPFNITDGQKFVKLYRPKTKFLNQPFLCKLSSGSFDVDISDDVDQDGSISTGGNDEGGNNYRKPPPKPIIVSAEKEADMGTQYFNCSSSSIRCAQLSCHIYNWPVGTETAEVSVELEIDLSVMAKYISVKGGAIFMTSATANIQSLRPQMAFVGVRVTSEEVVTQIQPDTLLGEGIPWWVILLAVLGGLLLLGLLAYGLYKTGFFKREKMEEMKAQQAKLEKNSYGTTNLGHIGD